MRFEAAPPGVPLPALTAIASSPLVMTLSSTSTLMQKSGSRPSVLPRHRGEKIVTLRIVTPSQPKGWTFQSPYHIPMAVRSGVKLCAASGTHGALTGSVSYTHLTLPTILLV